jgi:hypothetical protein
MLFVMPRCVYPIPKPPPEFVRPKPAPRPSSAAETQTEAMATATRVVTTPAVVRPNRLHEWRAAAAAKTRETSRAVVRKLTPTRFQMLVLVIIVAFGLTGFAMFRARQRSHAESVLSEAVRHGREALAERKLDEAARFFQQASDALDVLGRDDPTSRAIRQQARETTAASALCAKSLPELLAEAIDTDAGRFGRSWPDVFRASYRDSWIVWETMVSRRMGASAGESKFIVDHPIAFGSQAAVVHADLPAFEALGIDGEPRTVIFAAQLQAMEAGPLGGKSWTIVLRPDTAFAWCDASNLEAIGLVIDEQTKAALADQSRRMGISSAEQPSAPEVPE